tara:strand:- start:219 stop:635 length:417 start_codon:yes stop_codon:yes gene_type:complete
MIKYNLKCKCGKTFESWFPSSTEYDSLIKKKLVSCIYCGSINVKKEIMAPNLTGKSNKNSDTVNLEKIKRKELLNLRKYIEKNFKDVGENFPQEARSIHYDKKTSKGIYGKATAEETADLIDEGIEITSVPWIKKIDN